MRQETTIKFAELLKRVVFEAYALAMEHKDKRRYSANYNFPFLMIAGNGFPQIAAQQPNRTSYYDLFGGPDLKLEAIFEKLGSFSELVDLVWNEPQFHSLLAFPGLERDENTKKLLQAGIFHSVNMLVERYISLFGIKSAFNIEQFEPVLSPYLQYLNSRELICDICVPILFIQFEFDSLEIAPNALIEKIPHDFQAARADISRTGIAINEDVMISATHWLVLKEHPITSTNKNPFDHSWYTNRKQYPLQKIDMFFAAIRTFDYIHTGYAQVLIRPNGWIAEYINNLAPLYGTTVRSYPAPFDEGYWLMNKFPFLSVEMGKTIGEIFAEYLQQMGKSIEVAARRLNYCFNRDNAGDRILDACIGLEALLLPGERQELRYRLATRLAVLSSLTEKLDSPVEIVKQANQVYDYRSAIAHGGRDVQRLKEIIRQDKEPIDTSVRAVEFLQLALRELLRNPQYRNPQVIDNHLISLLPHK